MNSATAKAISVTLPAQPAAGYQVRIGSNILTEISEYVELKKYSRIVIVSDDQVYQLWGKALKYITDRHICIPPGESAKNVQYLEKVWQGLVEHQCDRHALVLNLGGGVIGDLGGFAASTYMRGIDFVQIPTTLLSQVDASVGGKLAIDFAGGKNLIGSFQQPKAVIIDVQTLTTLSERELRAGFAEILKHGLIKDTAYFKLCAARDPKELASADLVDIIARSVELKAAVVEEDVTEQHVRKLLNCGHTIGHALEALSHETGKAEDVLLHGEAIALGLLAEAKLAEVTGISTEDLSLPLKTALSNCRLPLSINFSVKAEAVCQRMLLDKKNKAGEISFSLPTKIGAASFDQRASTTQIIEALSVIGVAA